VIYVIHRNRQPEAIDQVCESKKVIWKTGKERLKQLP